MHTTISLLSKEFGQLFRIRGIVYYNLSPHEQKPFAGAFSKGIPNIARRAFPEILFWMTPMVLGTGIYMLVEELNRLSKRKNPADFLNEVDPNPPEEEEKKDC